MKQINFIALVCLLFFLVPAVNAQAILKASNPAIRYDLIKPLHTFAKVSIIDSVGNVKQEFVNETVVKPDSATHQIIFTRFRQVPVGRFMVDSSVIGPSPVSMHSVDNPLKRELTVKFSSTSVAVKSFIKGVHKEEAFTMKEGYFDDNMLEDIAGYLPLQKGVDYYLECYRYESTESKGVNPYHIKYLFDDYLKNANGQYTAGKVLYFTNGYSTGYVWIDKLTHENLKEVIDFGTGTAIITKA